jgi:hypothetical protein
MHRHDRSQGQRERDVEPGTPGPAAQPGLTDECYVDRWRLPSVFDGLTIGDHDYRARAVVERATVRAKVPDGVVYVMPKNRVVESMTRLTIGPYSVRIWRTEASMDSADNADLRDALRTVDPYLGPAHIAKVVESFERVAAIEVLDADGNGSILYPDWS